MPPGSCTSPAQVMGKYIKMCVAKKNKGHSTNIPMMKLCVVPFTE